MRTLIQNGLVNGLALLYFLRDAANRGVQVSPAYQHIVARMRRETTVVEYGRLALDAARKHVAECIEKLECDRSGVASRLDPQTAGPFCGCEGCIIRETLFAAWPYIFWASNSPHTPVPRIPEPLIQALVEQAGKVSSPRVDDA